MLTTVLRGLFGFLAACLVAGIIQAGFATAPELLAQPGQGFLDSLADAAKRTIVATIFSGLFAAPFVAVVVPVLAWQKMRSVRVDAAMGLTIAGAGQAVLYAFEAANQSSIANWYAAAAFGCAGLAGGLTFGLLAMPRPDTPPAEGDRPPPAAVAPPPVIVRAPATPAQPASGWPARPAIPPAAPVAAPLPRKPT